MPPRRRNDAQVDRLLEALKDVGYRKRLASKIAESEGIAYKSAMRRLQRYTTTASERRSFVRAPVSVRQQTVREARQVPLPQDFRYTPRGEQRPLPVEIPREAVRPAFYQDIEPARFTPTYQAPEREINNYDLRAIVAYFDGSADEAGETLEDYGADMRAGRLLDLAATGVDVLEMRGAGRLQDAVLEWQDTLSAGDFQDIEDFTALLMDLPDWQIQMLLEDMAESDSTFAEWVDAWRDSGMDIDTENSEYWKLWRAAYARRGKK